MKCICDLEGMVSVHEYNAPPLGETKFSFIKNYHRSLMHCQHCRHFLNRHNYNFGELYNGNYVAEVYGRDLNAIFKKIIALPKDKSDNTSRVNYIINFCKEYFQDSVPSVLDIGSGTCVFLYKLFQETGWPCLALDPDPLQAQHAKNIGINSVQADLLQYYPNEKYNLITLNKVIEHVQDPSGMLTHAATLLSPKGILYIEVPDGPEAFGDSPFREEFFIEHYHAFSVASIVLLLERLNMRVLRIDRIKEPSTKYSLRVMANLSSA